eukprot:s3719_g1.t1
MFCISGVDQRIAAGADNPYREQTLNQILTDSWQGKEMDGFEGENSSVTLEGRFDRRVAVVKEERTRPKPLHALSEEAEEWLRRCLQ